MVGRSIHPFEFHSPRLAFRPPRRTDLPFLCRLYADRELMKQISSHGGALSPIQAREKAEALLEDWARQGYGMFIISLRNSPGQPIGYCGFKPRPEPGTAELGYILDRPWWGQGLGLEAARRCLDLARTELGLKRLVAITHPQAAASQKILSKLGFTRASKEDGAHQGSDQVLFERRLADQ